jgi:zinc protease
VRRVPSRAPPAQVTRVTPAAKRIPGPSHRLLGATLCAFALAAQPAAAAATPAAATASIHVPVEYYRLPNGLRVVLSRDSSAPTVTVAVYYHIGFRTEPRDRTGFAHLFEHLMFEETTNLPKGEADKLVNGNGGAGNGSTRFDFTNYYEVVPSNALEPILWVEAERMRGLVLSASSMQNQKDVVKNEVRVNVLNRPYGSFPWIDLPQAANRNWYNAHNFYGEFADIDAATLEDVRAFYDTYYVPSNAVLVVAGDFERAPTAAAIERFFGPLPMRAAPVRPDVSEPPQQEARSASRIDPLAPRPALAFGYHVPPRNTPAWYAFGLIDQILLQGEDSRLWQRLVKARGYTDEVSGGINLLGNMFDDEGPTLWGGSLVHDASTSDERILADIGAEITRLQTELVAPAELARAITKIRSALYDVAGSSTRFGLVDLLASFALFDNDPARINDLEAQFRRVTPELLRQTAREYLAGAQQTRLSLGAGRVAGEKKP